MARRIPVTEKVMAVRSIAPGILILLTILLFISAAPTPREGHLHVEAWILEQEIEKFSKKYGAAALILYDPVEGEPVYIYNRPLTMEKGFPPGSLVKTFAAALLHQEKKHKEPCLCRGKYHVPEKKLVSDDFRIFNLPRDSKKKPYFRCSLRKGHGKCALRQALRVSCNTYFLTAAERNPELVADMAEIWGLEKMSRRWHQALGKKARLPVTPFRKQAAVIGEGGMLLLSPLQVARLYGGLLTSPPELKKRVTGPSIRFVRQCLGDVVGEGTLKRLVADNKKIDILGGKTGTATMYGQRYRTHGWNVILFQYNNRPCVLVTFVARGSGGREARRLSEIVMRGLKISPIN